MNDTVFIIVAVIVVIVSIIITYYFYTTQEGMVHYFDHIAMQASDPTLMHYMGRNKDILGKSRRGYYLENMLMYNNGVQPLMGNNPDAQFSNVTDYMGMNPSYRPKFTEEDGEYVMSNTEGLVQNEAPKLY